MCLLEAVDLWFLMDSWLHSHLQSHLPIYVLHYTPSSATTGATYHRLPLYLAQDLSFGSSLLLEDGNRS